MSIDSGDIIERDGRRFRVTIEYDDDTTPPWEREGGHGPVSEWRRFPSHDDMRKAPGEMLLCYERNSGRFYDFAEAVKIARRDGWGLDDEDKAKLAVKLGREPKPGDIVHEAAMQDFDRLRRWCADHWYYVGVIVELLDSDDEGTGERESLWGIESDCADYIETVAQEMAEQLLSAKQAARTAALHRIRSAPRHYELVLAQRGIPPLGGA